MRWIILTLLLANIALGGYHYWESTQPADDGPAPNQAELNNLNLGSDTLAELRRLERQAPTQPATEPPVQCVRITGFEEADQADVIESRLRALEVDAERVTRQVVVRSDYWVVLGPFDSSAIARERLGELQASDIESFLIGQGPLEGGISLGLFSSLDNAERRQQELTEQDIEARVERVDRTREALELTIGKDDAGLISDAALESLLNEFEGVTYQRFSC